MLTTILLFLHTTSLLTSETYNLNPLGKGTVYQGIGAISGGGATSKLLPGYDPETLSQIFDALFKDKFGLSLQILKVEIPGDCDSTSGSESSHMHTPYEQNYERGYEWEVMKLAKRSNPNILLSALPWCFPGWANMSPQKMANYVGLWVENAKTQHGLNIDMVGIWNEQVYNDEYIKLLRDELNRRGLNNTRIIAADGIGAITEEIARNSDLAAIVDMIGIHYPNKISYDFHGKPGIISEGRTHGNFIKNFNEDFINQNFTGNILWSMTTSYFHGLPYYGAGLIVASSPWSGAFEVKDDLYHIPLLTHFADIGWLFLRESSTIMKKGGSFVTLVSPNRRDVLILVDTTNRKKPFKIYFPGLDHIEALFVRVTSDTEKFVEQKPVWLKNRVFSYELHPNKSYSFSTVRARDIPHYGKKSNSTFYSSYFQNFEDSPESSEELYIAQQVGTFETVAGKKNKFYRQMVDRMPMFWGPVPLESPLAYFPPIENTAIHIISMHVRMGNNSLAMPFLCLRAKNGGIFSYLAEGIFFFYDMRSDTAFIYSDLQRLLLLRKVENATGTVPRDGSWVKMKFYINGDDLVCAFVNGILVFRDKVNTGKNGFVGFGLSQFALVDFDNFRVIQK